MKEKVHFNIGTARESVLVFGLGEGTIRIMITVHIVHIKLLTVC